MANEAVDLTPEPEVSPGPPAAARLANIFRGPAGIRAGWRALLFLLIQAALSLTIMVVQRLFAHARAQQITTLKPLDVILFAGPSFVIASVAALIMGRIEKRKYGQYGLPGRFAFRRDFWNGTLAGFLAISGCLLWIFAFHGFRLTGLALHGSSILAPTAVWTVAFILVGLNEEFSFRGYLQFTLTTGMGFWPSAIVLSLLFGAAHIGNAGETAFGLFSVVLFGLLFCFFLWHTGNLWYAVGFHAGWDWSQTFFYGVSDSGMLPSHHFLNSAFSGPRWLTGGSVGPEASIFTPIMLGIVAIVFSRVYGERKYSQSSTV
jgi:membrane protease YdiL (CAAX protease family)